MPTSKIGIIVALGIEAGGLIERMSQVVSNRGDRFQAAEGKFAERSVVVATSGPGGENAARATDALIRGHTPNWIISAGFAGALQPQLKRNDLVLATEVIDRQQNQFHIDAKFNLPSFSEKWNLHQGKLLSVDQVITNPNEKQQLGQQYDAVAVDMETIAVAQQCMAKKIPLISVRVISDTMEDQLPEEIGRLIQQSTTMSRFGSAMRSIFKRPSSIKDMWNLKETALIASEQLALFLEELLEALPVDEDDSTSSDNIPTTEKLPPENQ